MLVNGSLNNCLFIPISKSMHYVPVYAPIITKTRLFKYIENFTTKKKLKFSGKKKQKTKNKKKKTKNIFFTFLLKT